MGVENRFRGQNTFDNAVIGGVAQSQTPTITNAGNSSVEGRKVTVITIATVGQTHALHYHLEDTASALLTALTVTAAGAAHTSGNTAVGRVFPDSIASYSSGWAITSSTGTVTLALTSTGTSTARMFLTLPNGLVISGSTIAFT